MNLRSHWQHIALTAALGLVAGLFAARLLAEEWPATFAVLALREPAGAAATALLAALLLVGVWLVACRLAEARPDATPLLPLALLGLYVFQPAVDLTQAWVLLAGSLLLVANLLDPLGERSKQWLTLVGVILVAFLLYLRTLAPGVIVGDAAEFQTVLPTLGIAHPTGYPLYTILGWLVTRVPVGDVAWRVNLFSAACGALAVGVVYLIAERLIGGESTPGKRAVSVVAALTFAATPTWWAQCVMAEIYALGTLLMALAMYAVLRWGENGERRAESGGRGAESFLAQMGSATPIPARWLWLAAGCVGLGLAHHRTIVFLVPAVLAYVLLTNWRIALPRKCPPAPKFGGEPGRKTWRPREWLPALPLLLLPLLLYAYFPLRWPALHAGQAMTGEQFEFLVLAKGYAPALRLDAILAPDRWDIYLRLLVEQFGLAGLALAGLGAIWLAVRRRRALVLTGLLYVTTVLFGLAYFVPDVSVFFIPAHLVLALWIGCGLWGVAQAVRGVASPAWQARLALATIGLTIAALLPLSLVWTHLPAVDLSGETAAQDWGERALSYPLAQNAVVICDVHRLAPLNYLAHGAGWRLDMEIVMPDTEAQAREIIARALAAGRPVYLARFVPGLESIYALRSVGPLVEVSPSPLTAPPPIDHPVSTEFGGVMRLLGYNSNLQSPTSNLQSPTSNLQSPTSNLQSPTSNLHYTFVWQAIAPASQNLHPRLRLVDAAGRTWAEEPGRPPVDGLYPPTAWPAGSVVPDYHELAIPPGTPPGEYCVQVRLTPPFAEEGLPTSNGADAVTLETVTVAPATEFIHQPDHPTRARFGNLLLMGYDQAETARPGGRARLTLYWRVLGPVESSIRYVVRWRGEGSWEETIVPASSRWQPGEVRQESLTVPVPLSPTGPGQLWLGLRDANGNLVPVRSGWLALPARWCPLASLDIEGTPVAGLANFDDQALLIDATVSPTTLSPGEDLQVTLRWQCVGHTTTDYTVFLHLLDAGERIHGQVDAQPIYGTRPTSTWLEGEIIDGDVYTFPVAVDAPPGTYRLEVGLYDAATMTRLVVLDDESKAVGDRVLLPQTIEVSRR